MPPADLPPVQVATANPSDLVPNDADVATAVESVTGMATPKPAASDEPDSIVEAALPDPSQMPPADLPPVHVATANPSDLVPVTQDFRYLIYYVWSDLPPPHNPPHIVFRSPNDTPLAPP